MMTAGTRLYPNQEAQIGEGATVRYGPDGNVVFGKGYVLWSPDVSSPDPGWLELQAGDGHLVARHRNGQEYWWTNTFGPNARLVFQEGKIRILYDRVGLEQDPWPSPPPPPGPKRALIGPVRQIGQSFGDATGPRIVHGCSDFPAVVKFHQDRDKVLRDLDAVAPYVQYIRVLWRLNGWMWSGGPRHGGGVWPNANLSIDPTRDSWFDDALRGYCQAAHERGLRLNLSSGDMNNWSLAEMENGFTRVAQIAASVSPDLVWLHAVTNEMWGTWDGQESDDNIARAEHLLRIVARHAPHAMRAISDPNSRDKAGMQRLSGGSANCALIHGPRWSNADAVRRSFNNIYENYPGEPVVEDEPTGPNGSPRHSEFHRHVYQPTDDPDELFALYTMHILTGQASTYFNDPALVSREPLASTWGLKEIPALWRQMEIPEDIGQGEVLAGHRANTMLRVVGSHAHRGDGTTRGAYNLGVISGGSNWRVRSGRDGVASGWRASGKAWERRVSQGEVLDEPGPKPTVVRIVS